MRLVPLACYGGGVDQLKVGLTRPALFSGKGVKDTSRSASYVLLSVVALMMVMLAMSVALLSPSGVR
jgi:hypothetical protein